MNNKSNQTIMKYEAEAKELLTQMTLEEKAGLCSGGFRCIVKK